LILSSKCGYFFVRSFTEKEAITTNSHSSIAVAVAILLISSQNKAISQRISSD
jgi:hypothetical protein